MTAAGKPHFVHVGTDDDLEALRMFAFERVNVCTKRKVADAGGWFLLFVGETYGDQGEHYSGHRYIVRCRTPDYHEAADAIVRERLQAVGVRP